MYYFIASPDNTQRGLFLASNYKHMLGYHLSVQTEALCCRYVTDNAQQRTLAMGILASTQNHLSFSQTHAVFVASTSFILLCTFVHSL